MFKTDLRLICFYVIHNKAKCTILPTLIWTNQTSIYGVNVIIKTSTCINTILLMLIHLQCSKKFLYLFDIKRLMETPVLQFFVYDFFQTLNGNIYFYFCPRLIYIPRYFWVVTKLILFFRIYCSVYISDLLGLYDMCNVYHYVKFIWVID